VGEVSVSRRRYPHSFHVALDGSGLNGLEGRAGVSVLKYDPADDSYAYKVIYFRGLSGGHAPSVNPGRSVGFLGNVGQHLLFYNAATLDEADRVSTLRFEMTDSTIKGSTHVVWLDDVEFLAPIGDRFWRFDVHRLNKAQPVGPHRAEAATCDEADRLRLLCRLRRHGPSGSSEAREVGILDLRWCGTPGRATDDLLARRRARHGGPLLHPVVPGRRTRGTRLARVGDVVLLRVRFRTRRRVRGRRAPLGGRAGDTGRYQFRCHGFRHRADLVQRRQPDRRTARSRQLRRLPHPRRAA
jgi:hypothetical protein